MPKLAFCFARYSGYATVGIFQRKLAHGLLEFDSVPVGVFQALDSATLDSREEVMELCSM
jgi:hypothetical protein